MATASEQALVQIWEAYMTRNLASPISLRSIDYQYLEHTVINMSMMSDDLLMNRWCSNWLGF